MADIHISMPAAVEDILTRLEEAGHEAYVVGGCVRDSLLGLSPKDWDVTTSAAPAEVAAVFHGKTVLETGLPHGTLTILSDAGPVEVTTFRVDGAYADGRHPDAVRFTSSLREDLLRRDFTVNAIAYHPRSGLADPAGGLADLQARRLRCVGRPDDRFMEDGLRILRALRFSSVLDFTIESGTAAALTRCRDRLDCVAAERVAGELTKLLCGQAAARVLLAYPAVITHILPELAPMLGFDQRNPHHIYDVYEHTVYALAAVPPQPVLRLTMLFHDAGKPSCFTLDEQGIGHFHGHPQVSVTIARDTLTRLRYDNRTIERVCTLVKWHDVLIDPTLPRVRRLLNKLGEDAVRQLLLVKAADCRAQAPEEGGRTALVGALSALVDQVVAEGDCFTLRDLAVDGHDLQQAGWLPGRALGETLHALLDAVMEGRCPNDRDALLRLAAGLRQGVEPT